MPQTAQAVETATPTMLDKLAFEYAQAKAEENEARHKRLAIEEQILSIVELKPEGTATEEGEFYKVSATTGFTRKITEPVELSRAVTPEQFEKLVRVKYELNMRSLKALQDMAPETYQTVSRFIEATPKKPSLEVEESGLSK